MKAVNKFVLCSGVVKTVATVFCLVGLTLSASAASVASEDAVEAVKGWTALKEALGEDFSATPEGVMEYHGLGGTGTYYVVNLEGGGFVVTAGDTAMEPVLAYSKEGAWNTNAAENPLMAMLNIDVAAMMAGLTEHSSAITAGGGLQLAAAGGETTASTQQQAAAAKWARLRTAASAKGGRRLQASAPSADLRVSPLVTTAWYQSTVNNRNVYNYYTPGNYVCGCVATMGAQIMRYWQWPDSSTNITYTAGWYSSCGSGSWDMANGYTLSSNGSRTPWIPSFGGTYDWSNMPNSPTGRNSTQNQAIGKLTRDVGLSCYMNYQSGASGAPGGVFGHRLVDQFAYANAKIIGGWNKDAALASLDAGLPCGVNVSGSDGGHAIVADGYGYDSSGTLYVHFNMGWGSVGSDTWYTPPNVGSFTSVQNVIYNAYPPSKGDPDLTVVSGRVLNNGSAVGGATVTAVCRETGRSYSATSASSTGKYALMLPAGLHTITATSGSSSTRVIQRVKSCLTSIAAGAGGLSFSGTPENIYGFDLDVSAGGAYSVSTSLAHRWSFNGNLNDSVGSSTATTVGSNVTIADGKAKLTGSGNGAGSLNLGANLLNTTAATIEIWASQTAARNWSRIFDYGADNTHYFCLTWSYGGDTTNDRAGCKNTSEVAVDTTMAPYKLGRQFHISATFEQQRDGTTFVRWMRRDAATGVLQKSGTMTIPNGIQTISNPILYLGHSFYSGDSDACAEYDEVRIWNGVLSDAQLSVNANAGPDTLLTSVPSSETLYVATAKWKGGTTAPTSASLANAANWTCLDQNGNSISGVPGEKTTVIIPAGDTSFTIPAGYTPSWRKIQFGEGKTATFWGSKAASNGSNAAFMEPAMGDYTIQGQGSVDDLHNGIIHNPNMNYPSALANSQFRYDGWFYVTSAQAGNWGLHGYVDDYLALKIDDEWAIFGRTMGQVYANVDVKAGWHKFRLIVGDTGGGYGGRILESTHHFVTPLAIKINGAGEYAFSSEHFTFGSGTETVKLIADCDWSALGEVTVDSGAVIDLNGHELKVDSIVGDSLNAWVISSESDAKLSIYSGTAVDTANLNVQNVTVATEHTATPTTSSSTTFFADSHSVTLQCATDGATIRYTTDGSEPTVSSAVYSTPITITGTTTIKAVAFADAYLESETFTQTFTLTGTVATPVASPAASTFYDVPTSVTLACATTGATIRYTTDGSAPTASSPAYTGAISISDTTTLKAKAFVTFTGGTFESDVLTAVYTLAEQVSTPTFSPNGTSFFATNIVVELACATQGATIRYTSNGSEPTSSSTVYTEPVTVTGTTTLKAKAFATGYRDSSVATATFTSRQLIGDNLVPAGSEFPANGGTAAVATPAAGDYDLTFSYSGSAGSSATVYVKNGGTVVTNFTLTATDNASHTFSNSVALASGGDYTIELVKNTGSGIALDDVSFQIPDTEENRQAYWVYETMETTGATGFWSTPLEWDVKTKLAEFEGERNFMPYTESGGNTVTLQATVSFSVSGELPEPDPTAQCALTLSDGTFQVLSLVSNAQQWVAVEAAGLTPMSGTSYTVYFELDYRRGTYSVGILDNGTYKTFAAVSGGPFAAGTTDFALATNATKVSQIGFRGTGVFSSLLASYETVEITGFEEGDEIALRDSAGVVLSAARATWLNGFGEKSAVSGRLAGLSEADFDKAYLCNLELMGDFSASLDITDISVGSTNVEVTVRLTRTGAKETGGVAEPITGVLKFYGAATVGLFGTNPLSTATITDEDFSEGDTTKVTVPKNGEGPFFKAKIIER